jgi:hypothetical protein
MAFPSSVSPRLRDENPGFWSLARAEARATWGGRFRLLWLLSAVAVLGWVSVSSDLAWLSSHAFLGLCWLACWVPAWLGADLLSLRFPANPEPHREWHPREFLARAMGRLGPFYLALLLWVTVYTGRVLFYQLAHPGNPGMFSPPEIKRWRELPSWWVAWIAVFLASSLPYAAGAALLSALARRPRRWLMAPVVVVLGSMALLLLLALFSGVSTGTFPYSGQAAFWPGWELVIWPNFWVGFYSLMGPWTKIAGQLGWGSPSFPAMCWMATGAFVAYGLPCFVGAWVVAARRHRRHPFSGRPVPNAA